MWVCSTCNQNKEDIEKRYNLGNQTYMCTTCMAFGPPGEAGPVGCVGEVGPVGPPGPRVHGLVPRPRPDGTWVDCCGEPLEMPPIPVAEILDPDTIGQNEDIPMAEEVMDEDFDKCFDSQEICIPDHAVDGTIRPSPDTYAQILSEMSVAELATVFTSLYRRAPNLAEEAFQLSRNPSFRPPYGGPVSGSWNSDWQPKPIEEVDLSRLPVAVGPGETRSFRHHSNPADAELNYMFQNSYRAKGQRISMGSKSTNPCSEVVAPESGGIAWSAPDGRTAEQDRTVKELREHYEKYRHPITDGNLAMCQPDCNGDIYLSSGLPINVKERLPDGGMIIEVKEATPEEEKNLIEAQRAMSKLQLIMGGQVSSTGGLKSIGTDYKDMVRREMEDQKSRAAHQDAVDAFNMGVNVAFPDPFADIHDPSVPDDAFDLIVGGVAVGHLSQEERNKALDDYYDVPKKQLPITDPLTYPKLMESMISKVTRPADRVAYGLDRSVPTDKPVRMNNDGDVGELAQFKPCVDPAREEAFARKIIPPLAITNDELDRSIPSPPFAWRKGAMGLVTVDTSDFDKKTIKQLTSNQWDKLSRGLKVLTVQPYEYDPLNPGKMVKRSKEHMDAEIRRLNEAAGYPVE